MNLKQFWEHRVIIESINRKIYRGVVSEYIFPEDNENGKESIIVDAVGYGNPMEFYEKDIKSIEIIR